MIHVRGHVACHGCKIGFLGRNHFCPSLELLRVELLPTILLTPSAMRLEFLQMLIVEIGGGIFRGLVILLVHLWLVLPLGDGVARPSNASGKKSFQPPSLRWSAITAARKSSCICLSLDSGFSAAWSRFAAVVFSYCRSLNSGSFCTLAICASKVGNGCAATSATPRARFLAACSVFSSPNNSGCDSSV